MTHVANGYDRDIRACVKANKIEVYEETMGIDSNIGVDKISAAVAHRSHQKRNYVTQDPGFTTIKPGGFFGFAESGPDGHVFVTIQIGSEIPHANVQVYNDSNVLVDDQGSLRNVQYKKIWTDTTGQKHKTPAPSKKEINNAKEEEKVKCKVSKEKVQSRVSKEKQDEQTNESKESAMESTGEEWQSRFELADSKIISVGAGLFSETRSCVEENKGKVKPKKKSKDNGKSGKGSSNDFNDDEGTNMFPFARRLFSEDRN